MTSTSRPSAPIGELSSPAGRSAPVGAAKIGGHHTARTLALTPPHGLPSSRGSRPSPRLDVRSHPDTQGLQRYRRPTAELIAPYLRFASSLSVWPYFLVKFRGHSICETQATSDLSSQAPSSSSAAARRDGSM